MLKNFVLKMIELKRFEDLLNLLSENSIYSSDSMNNIPQTKDEVEQYNLSVHHIRFLQKFGDTDLVVVDGDGKVYRWYIDNFNEWLENGVKGLEMIEVENYLKDHPFPTI
ncbi:hypothetical protein [Acinetobacter nosocomialis]|uniref:hypothetical protein n=1 Tax=Acinetobacter nosocomialis TaxID=106654 RepID=UPI0019628942|nr:hypothetical protein [Acinetobacter nosocomialis]MBM9549781.1 hypothetical protein [Acinetobacter nosocomialis]MCJ9032484.1 hypothetical protein [Acinetobacter nosocomialis]